MIEQETGGAARNPMHTPVGEPVRDATNFFMSLTGGMIIGSSIVMIGGLAAFVNFVLRGSNLLGTVGGLVGLGLGLIALGFLIYAIRDATTPPARASGFISNRREVRRQVREAGGYSTEFHYEVEFTSDEAHRTGGHPITLRLTKEQYEASGRTNRAYIVYSARLGNVRLYQPLRSIY